MDLNTDQKFEALKMRFEDQSAVLRAMTEIDQKLFLTYCTLELLLASWLGEHGPDSLFAILAS